MAISVKNSSCNIRYLHIVEGCHKLAQITSIPSFLLSSSFPPIPYTRCPFKLLCLVHLGLKINSQQPKFFCTVLTIFISVVIRETFLIH